MSGIILYQGPSAFDGAPIVVIATGIGDKTRNAKTGDMVQTWILRSDVSPRDAVNAGSDASICGDCPLRGATVDGRNVIRACYVRVDNAPRSVFASFLRGIYSTVTPDEARAALAGRKVRLGAYGDPAAVPFGVWQTAIADASGVTGYSHAWRRADKRFASILMASADTPDDAALARAMGYRTFRVRLEGAPKERKETICPASAEAGHKTTCASCLACGGTSSRARASIVIAAHGAGAAAFARL